MRNPLPEPEVQRGFQFSVRHALLLLTTCAALLSLVRFTRLPLLAQVAISLYLISIASYLMLRGPALWREIMTQRERRRQLLDRREDLRQWTAEIRARDAAAEVETP